MREKPIRRACPPPAGRYYPYANGSLQPPLSFVNDASSSATIHRREKPVVRLCGVRLSHSFPWRRGRATDRRRTGTTFLARRVVSAPSPTDSDGTTADGWPATGSRALAVEAAGRLLHYPSAVHTPAAAGSQLVRGPRTENTFRVDAHFSEDLYRDFMNRFEKRFDKRIGR